MFCGPSTVDVFLGFASENIQSVELAMRCSLKAHFDLSFSAFLKNVLELC